MCRGTEGTAHKLPNVSNPIFLLDLTILEAPVIIMHCIGGHMEKKEDGHFEESPYRKL